jgi:dihydroorotase
VDDDAKQMPFAEAEAGATGLELLLPLALKWAEQERIPLLDALAHITIKPAQLLGQKMGHLSVGAHADICVFDPKISWKVERDALRSQGKNTPFNGYEMQGRVRYTLLDGQVVFQQ